ncbi:MAG TPA: M20 family metallopeptidase [Gemmatimonadales bacterium]|nr:M20 family metallopeptidase [Gemmatimonadales bacterium]
MTITLPPVDRAQLVADRRDLHQHPELGFEETRTAALVAQRLGALGYTVRTGVATTGVLAVRGEGPRCVLLRADMDALPVEEANDVPYRSRVPGKMHACGHDGHVAIGLEAARRLAQVRLPGAVKFAFQPAEEISGGAERLIAEGALHDPAVQAAFGLHLWNDLPLGTIGIRPGPVMAAVDHFAIEIQGRGGHAAAPHQAVDPVVAAAHIVSALQTLVSRARNPTEEGVVSVTRVHAGEAFNVIPDRAELAGTVRSFGGRFHDDSPDLVRRTAEQVAAAFGARAEVRYRRLSPPVVNDERMTALMREVAVELVGPSRVRDDVRTMGGEDMACYLAAVPGCFAFVGAAPRQGGAPPHHSPRFDIEEEALVIGTELLTRTALRYLETA